MELRLIFIHLLWKSGEQLIRVKVEKVYSKLMKKYILI